MEQGFGVDSKQGVYSSDSTAFADKGIPAISFARLAPPHTATYHNRHDTIEQMSGEQTVRDIAFITAFADRMANALRLPIARTMPDNMKDELDKYLTRKRK
jgi:Iap family predicted aminopeptidase